MPATAFIGTGLSHGGTVTQGSPNVKVNGHFVARLGDAVVCTSHGARTIVSACSTTVFANGKAVAHLGSIYSCGAVLIAPVSPNVSVGV